MIIDNDNERQLCEHEHKSIFVGKLSTVFRPTAPLLCCSVIWLLGIWHLVKKRKFFDQQKTYVSLCPDKCS